MSNETKKTPGQENTILNLLFNIVIPVFILNKLTARLGPGPALLLALAFPLSYGAYDLIRRRKANPFSLLGLLNILITGGLAWIGINGFWFAVKEAAFPLLIGIFVLASSWGKKPAVAMLFVNPALFHMDRMNESLKQHGREKEFEQLLKRATRWLAGSFFLSATLNFLLAERIFLPMADNLDEAAKSVLLNDQIATMTQWSLLVILLPSMIFLSGILYGLIVKVRALTGLKDDEFMKIN